MDKEDLSSNYYAGKVYFPVTQETLDKLVKNGILDEQVVLVQPKKSGWISVDRSKEILKKWKLE